MQTSGHGNDALMILVPVGVAIIAGTILFGGPAETVEAVDAMVRTIAYEVIALVSALF